MEPTILDDQRCGSRTGGSGGLTGLLAQMSERAADPGGRWRPLGWQEAGRLGAVLQTTQHGSLGRKKKYKAVVLRNEITIAALPPQSQEAT